MSKLYHKYEVVEAETGDKLHNPASCFVLVPRKDRHAKVALAAYAESVKQDDPELAKDMRTLYFD